jgi:hypothetical protein
MFIIIVRGSKMVIKPRILIATNNIINPKVLEDPKQIVREKGEC